MSSARVLTAEEERLVRRATLVFPASGRLGNQLFQYVAMQGFRTAEQRLILVDFDDLDATFTGIDAILLSTARVADRLRLTAHYRSRHLFGSPLGLIRPDPDTQLPHWDEPAKVATVRGYYQRELPEQERHAGALRFRQHIEAEAIAFLRDRLVGPASAPVAFVHVRRGDYLTHSVGPKHGGLGWVAGGEPVALPAAWYRAQMERLRQHLPGVRFLIVGDDPAWASDALATSDCTVSDRSAPVDLAMLARCDAGVLSASSFAWWGAWFASRSSSGPFVAPEFWLGHAVGAWWPVRVRSDFLSYAPVSRGAGRGEISDA